MSFSSWFELCLREVDYSTQLDRDTTVESPALKHEILRGRPGSYITGIRPGRKGGLRIEEALPIKVGDSDHEIRLKVIHAYGMGGGGYKYSAGVGLRVAELVNGFAHGSGETRWLTDDA
ncbi:hypothetical protein K435DRAFT_965249 [Dendrothele bispora CBS 962.96]|uniref:Uncharacterized protein n=1 Tax=Dendrothele bispora (strain CBS 962.96) TaxID=1314807 RepID=A0A4S8M6Q3_DENBC|nr:hypothetical protein K435DRAFT_965249 [Dendrothele bispora CBS 962.96]